MSTHNLGDLNKPWTNVITEDIIIVDKDGNSLSLNDILKNITNNINKIINGAAYSICNTEADNTNKKVTIENYEIKEGSLCHIKFTNGIGANNTLSINNSEDYDIYYSGNKIKGFEVEPGEIAALQFADNKFILLYTDGNAGKTLISGGKISDNSIDNYFVCSGTDLNKKLTSFDCNIPRGTVIYVKFTSDVLANTTFSFGEEKNINILFGGAPIKDNVIFKDETAAFLFDGDNFNLLYTDTKNGYSLFIPAEI